MTAEDLLSTNVPNKRTELVRGDGALLGEDVLPGFSCTLATVL